MSSHTPPAPLSLFVDSKRDLAELCERLRDTDWFALDTEFERERTYHPKLCLVQVGTPELIACVDPVGLADLDPLLELLFDPHILKVVHAASQDCAVFYSTCKRVPDPLFDTQIAAAVLDHAEQTGYATLVEAELGVRLAKTATRTDWCRRPLSREQIGYAEDDVRYLVMLYPRLLDALRQRGRLAWLDEDFRTLADPLRYSNPPELAWQRLRGIERLSAEEFATAAALAAWREQTAEARDLPRNWLLKDAALVSLARRAPADVASLREVPDLSEKFCARHGQRLLEIIRAADDDDTHDARPAPSAKLDTAVLALLAELRDVVRLIAQRENFDANQLASRKRLTRLAQGEPFEQVIRGWRAALLEAPLNSVLQAHRAGTA